MAVNKTPVQTAMRLRLQTGVDEHGNPVIISKSLSNVKIGSLDQDIYDVALTLTNLQAHTLSALQRVDTADLEEVI